jgi:hypothetical protein
MEEVTKLQGVTQVVQEIYERDGEVVASVLVDEARPEDSPAHPAFEWRDDVAAEEYRLEQARRLIRRVTIHVDNQPEKLAHVVADTGEGYYKPLSAIVQVPSEYDLALKAALSRLSSAREAVNELKTAAEKHAPGDDRLVTINHVAQSLALLNDALRTAVH